jgi:hypothetical protein
MYRQYFLSCLCVRDVPLLPDSLTFGYWLFFSPNVLLFILVCVRTEKQSILKMNIWIENKNSTIYCRRWSWRRRWWLRGQS